MHGVEGQKVGLVLTEDPALQGEDQWRWDDE